MPSSMMDIEQEAGERAEEVLRYFRDLELLGGFAGQTVNDQKRTFLVMTLVNFARKAMWTARQPPEAP
jgi:hypothetical protein